MKIKITDREFNAINEAINDWSSNLESWASQSYAKAVKPDIAALNRVVRRYKKCRLECQKTKP